MGQHPQPPAGNNEANSGGDEDGQLGNEQSHTGGEGLSTKEATMPSPVQNYPEMILEAIKVLDGRGDKPNKTEIKKYIEDEGNYTNLPQGNELRKVINGNLDTMNKIFLDIHDADRRAETDIYNLHVEVRNIVIDASREDSKSLIETYTGNTSLVAILIATITFAAAFTLPGGYSSEAGSEGLPIMARKLAFQAFLIFDTLAMCSSLAVAFICVIARWKDFEFLLHYRFFTKKLMWFAYMATTLAFATGLYTVLAGRLHWLAIAICVLSALLPILTMLKIRYRTTPFNSDFLDMV